MAGIALCLIMTSIQCSFKKSRDYLAYIASAPWCKTQRIKDNIWRIMSFLSFTVIKAALCLHVVMLNVMLIKELSTQGTYKDSVFK